MEEPWKLIVLFEPPEDWATFEADWQTFMGLAEKMPGLRRELLSRATRPLGERGVPFALVHELLFDSREALEKALASEEGQAAALWLHKFTHGRINLLIGPHQEAQEKDFGKREKGSGQPA